MSKSIRLTVLSESAARTRGVLQLTADSTVIVRGAGGADYVCGKCGSVLLAQVERQMFQNAAGRCNQCNRANDLSRPARIEKCPAMLADLHSLPPPKDAFAQSLFWGQSPPGKELLGLSNKLLGEWADVQGERPRHIYHYTSSAGLRGILASHTLWATDMAFMNDASEMLVGLELIEEIASALSSGGSDSCKELLRRAKSHASPSDVGSGFLVVCSCAEGDLLSQWRAYGESGGGYAIGLSAFELDRPKGIFVRRVIYDRDVQTRLVQSTIQKTCNLLDRLAHGRGVEQLDADKVLPAFATFLSDHLREFLFTFKHKAFAEENEWRVIFPFVRDHHITSLRFRESHGMMVPYIPFPLRPDEDEYPILPIVDVVHGPTLHPELAKKSLHLLLQQHGYDHVEVAGSEVPLRP